MSRGFAPFFHPVTVPEDFTPTSAATTFGAFPFFSHKATYLLQNIKISYRKLCITTKLIKLIRSALQTNKNEIQ
nr:MAG TPA: hypothetical protein [Caudoviricetes sp.]